MDIRSEILKEHSKAQAKWISGFIGNNQSRFDELFNLFLNDEYRVTQRAGWVISHCADVRPHLIQPHLEALVNNLKKPKIHDAVMRNSLRILTEQDIPEHLQGPLLEICFDQLLSMKVPVAIKVHAMQVIYNISQNEPDLLNELKMVIEEQMPYGTAGFKSRGRKILKVIASRA